MKRANLLALLTITASTSLTFSTARAALIENGANFTGTYLVQEQACAERVFNYQTGEYELVMTLTVQGTAEGLVIDGRLQAISSTDLSKLPSGTGANTNANYVSQNEFLDQVAIHFENDQVPSDFITIDYKLETPDQLSITTTRLHPVNESDNRVCHYVRQTR